MPGPMQTLPQKVRRFLASLSGAGKATAAAVPEVIVHDPAAQRPHDLDDPFFDSKVQTRIADVIAGAGRKK